MTERFAVLPQWAPDGQRVYFSGPRESKEFWAVSVQDHTERLVADLSGKPGIPDCCSLATDGEYLYFAWDEWFGDIWVMDVVTDESE